VEIQGSIKFPADLSIDCKVEARSLRRGNLNRRLNAEIQRRDQTKSVTVPAQGFGNITVDESFAI